MIFSKEISKLKGQVGDLQGQLNAATGNVEALTQEKAQLEARIKELEAAQEGVVTKADHDAAILLKDGEIEKLQGQLKAVEKNVDQKVIEKIAEAGVPAAVRDPNAVDKAAKPDAGSGESPRKRLASLTKIRTA